MSKMVFGTFFDPGVELHGYTLNYDAKTRPFIAPDGSQYFADVSDDVYNVTLEWEGLTDSEIYDLERQLTSPQRYGGFIYTAGETNLLNEMTLLHYELEDLEYNKVFNDWNSLLFLGNEMR
jgi:hypothetical protein